MSGWLSSVNNLLENLDGQAETVAETVADVADTGITSNLRRLNNTIATNASAITNNITSAEYRNNLINIKTEKIESFDSEDYSSYDDDDSVFFEDDEFFDNEEFTTDGDDNKIGDAGEVSPKGKKASDAKDESGDTAVNVAKSVAKNVSDTASAKPAKTRHQEEDKPVSLKAENPAGNRIENTATMATAKNNKTKEPKTQLQKLPNSKESLAMQKKSSDVVSVHKQSASKSQKLTKLPNVEVSMKDDLAVSTKEKQKSLPSGAKSPGSSTTTPQNDGVPGASVTPGANSNSLSSLVSRKDVKSKNSTVDAKDPEDHRTLSDSSRKKDVAAVGKKLQQTSDVQNRQPPPSQKANQKPKTVAQPKITDGDNTESNSGKTKSTAEKMQKQQKDDVKLLKKQQQQHKQVVMSKNETIQSLESQLVKLREKLTKGAAEHEKLNQRTKDLDEKLQASEREIEAQADELRKAGEEMEKIRRDAKEEREDILDDHDDEMEDIQRNHKDALDKMRQGYETTIAEWKERYEAEESLRQQEGGDSIRELQNATKREREALKKLADVTEERSALKEKLDKLIGHETTLMQQVESSLESAETVAAREQRARDELDEAAALHAKQMAQRQRREAELEQTILEMGSALTLAKQQLQQQQYVSSPRDESSVVPFESKQKQINGSYYKEQYEQVIEELETVRVQFTMETQRREALQQELTEISKEREDELSLAQSRQLQHDSKVRDLESKLNRLQASIRVSKQQSSHSNDSIDRDVDESSNPQDLGAQQDHKLFNQELEDAKQEIKNLSEQLFRQQVLAKNSKSEILALKGRLKAANARAEQAENESYNPKTPTHQRSRAYDVESGRANSSNSSGPALSVRRRIKGGSSRGVRSIRSSLPCFGSGRASANGGVLDQVGLTIDAIDSWMVDTGSFMRHEPFARLGLLLYLSILHLWSFALVVFHSTEVEHGDFGSMDSNPRHWREHT